MHTAAAAATSTHQKPAPPPLPGHSILAVQQPPYFLPWPTHSRGPGPLVLPGPIQNILDAGGHGRLQGRVRLQWVYQLGGPLERCYDIYRHVLGLLLGREGLGLG